MTLLVYCDLFAEIPVTWEFHRSLDPSTTNDQRGELEVGLLWFVGFPEIPTMGASRDSKPPGGTEKSLVQRLTLPSGQLSQKTMERSTI